MNDNEISSSPVSYESDDPERALINRINMGRLFIFNIFGCAAVLLMTALLFVLKINLLPPGYQDISLLAFAGFLAVSAFTVYVTSISGNRRLFGKICVCELVLYSTVMFNFAFRAVSDVSSIVFFCVLALTLGILPILNPRHIVMLMAVETVPTILLSYVRGFSAESTLTLVAMGVASVCLSVAIYRSTVTNVENKLRLDTVVNEAETDPMTMLLNRRGLERRLEDVWPMCIRQNLCVAVLMIDIDNFKKYNDKFGHAAGDDCIRKVTGCIRRCVKRKTDYGARVGGEEFCVLLTGIDPRQAVKWSLDLKEMVDNLKIPHASTNFNPYVSVSMGLACSMVTSDITFEQLREEADRSLYDAKNNGRARLYYRHRVFGAQKDPAGKASGE